MSLQPPYPQTAPQQYSSDGRWYWDGTRWLPVQTAATNEVTIWASQLRRGGLPAVCVKTGQPADDWMWVSFRTTPPWTRLLLFIGLLPYLIARVTTGVQASGHLPTVKSVAWRRMACLIGGPVAVVIGVMVIALGSAFNSGATLAAGALLFVAGIGLLIGFRVLSPWAVVRKPQGYPHDRVVVLRRVHPNFVRAVQWQQQAAIQQPGGR